MDVKQAFHWTRAALLLPLAPGSTVIAFSSGAAPAGSPLSGGHAGAKATIRFLTFYAGEESERADLGIRFVSVLPRLTPDTALGAAAAAGHAERRGVELPVFLADFGETLTTEQVGDAALDLATAPGYVHGPNGVAYLLTAGGPGPGAVDRGGPGSPRAPEVTVLAAGAPASVTGRSRPPRRSPPDRTSPGPASPAAHVNSPR